MISSGIAGRDLDTYLSAARERPLAQSAFVRFLAGMDAHVQPQALLDRKRFGAVEARELIDAAVLRRNVILQAATLAEAQATVLARKWSLVRVDAQMLAQIVAVCEHFRTDGAFVGLGLGLVVGGRCRRMGAFGNGIGGRFLIAAPAHGDFVFVCVRDLHLSGRLRIVRMDGLHQCKSNCILLKKYKI